MMVATASKFDLTTIGGLRTYLIAKGQAHDEEIVLLSGGTANYVYRAAEIDGSTRVYKHAALYSHSNKNFALDVRRMDYEARILQLLSAANPKSGLLQQSPGCTVRAVPMVSYDQDHKLLCLADGGSRNLKAAYDDPQLELQNVGQRLAQWLVELHSSSREVSLALPSQTRAATELRGNNPVALHLYRFSYDNLHVALAECGYESELGARVNSEFGSLLASDDECICHGDFWPGNILLGPGRAQDEDVGLTVVDWELVRRGTSATDVGQFAAEAFLHDRFKGGRGLLAAFLGAYVKVRGGDVNKKWAKRMVVHWAVHVVYWPTRVEWTDREGTQQLVDMGVGVLKAVLEDDREKLEESPLLRDVKHIIGSLLA